MSRSSLTSRPPPSSSKLLLQHLLLLHHLLQCLLLHLSCHVWGLSRLRSPLWTLGIGCRVSGAGGSGLVAGLGWWPEVLGT